MDENKNETTQNNDSNNSNNSDRPHVRIFGANVDGGGASNGHESHDERRARRDEWKQKRNEQKMQWKAERRENWAYNHQGEGYFGGLILLLAGIIALSYTLGIISKDFWHAIIPFWPILLILWGASIVLGRHWFSRFILFIFTILFFAIIVFYGLVKTNSPLVSSLSPNVRASANNIYPPQQ